MKGSAFANSNIALVKYWGKRDERLILPQNGSISMTADGMQTHTTVEFGGKYSRDIIILNGEKLGNGDSRLEITRHLDSIRGLAGLEERAKVVTLNSFPTGAGLASSASGIAALTVAGTNAAGLEIGKKGLSVLARLGSGSACRSIYGGFVEWLEGRRKDGSDSYAVQIAPEDHWPEFIMFVAVTSRKEKEVRSRAGMKATVATSPFYKDWLESVGEDLDQVRKGISRKNFTAVGQTAERNCLKMHALMMSTNPPIVYWLPSTIRVMREVWQLRAAGTECYFTIDAGPQAKILCLRENMDAVGKALRKIDGVEDVLVCRPGSGASLTAKHLF